MLIPLGIFAQYNNSYEAYKTSERKKFKEEYGEVPFEVAYQALKEAITSGKTTNPDVFNKIKRIFFGLEIDQSTKKEHCVLNPLSRMIRKANWWDKEVLKSSESTLCWNNVRVHQHDYAYDLLKLAIEADAKNVVKFINDCVPFENINRVFFHKGTFLKYDCYGDNHANSFPSDLQILSECAHRHNDPKGMAQLLFSLRYAKNQSYPVKEEIQQSCNDARYSKYCAFLTTAFTSYQENMRKKMMDSKVQQ